jgi:arylsulfatase A-like enzyme
LDAKQEDIEVYKGREPHVNGQGNPAYAGMIRSTDQSVGRILDKLDALALSENTVVVFISDNGGLTMKGGKMGKRGKVRKDGSDAGTRITTNEPLRGGKAMIYEGGIRVPMAVRWPGTIKAGSNSHVPVVTDDFYPTILSLAGVKPRAGLELDGRDISPLFMGGKELDRDFLVWHFPHYMKGFRPDKGKQTFWNTPSSAIREGDWKLIEFYGRGVELYNLAKDIGEREDVAAEHPDRVKRMRAAMAKWLDDREAWIPQPNPEFDEEHPKSKSQSMRDERES